MGGREGVVRVRGVRALVLLAAALFSACSSSAGPDESPTSARVRIEGTSPHPLQLITSTEFYEQLNPLSGEIRPVLTKADTAALQLPYDGRMDLGTNGLVYVEVRNAEVATASIRMRVDLDNGESFDQSVTLSDDAALIYYFVFNNWSR